MLVLCVAAAARPLPAPLAAVVDPYRDALVLAAAADDLDGDARADTPVLGELLLHERLDAEAALRASLLADVPRDRRDKGKAIGAFLTTLESTSLRDADKLAFVGVLTELGGALDAAPPGSARDALVTRVAADREALARVEETYREEMRKILGQLAGTRGMTLTRERWDAYLAAIRAERPLSETFARYSAALAGNEESSGRGGAADNAYEIYGTSLPDKTFVLTFDDGPDPVHTAAILDTLAARGVHAVFFEVGQNVASEAPDGAVTESAAAALTHRLVREGHLLGNHTWSHANLPTMTDAEIAEQIDKSDRVLGKVAGRDVALFRPPYGSRNAEVLAEIADRSERAYLWNVDSRDWADPIPESIAQTVYRQATAAGRGVILMHDVHPQSAAAVPLVLDLLARDGYQVVLYDGDNVVGPAPSAAAAAPPTLYGSSWAVIVGIDQYAKWPDLAYAVNDAEGVREALVGSFGFPEDHVITLLDGEATRERVLRVLGDELPRKVGPEDRVFVFWAGHGATRALPGGAQRGYLVPADADLTSLQTTAISMTELQDVQEALAAKHVWFVTDACYSGLALTRGGAGDYDPQRYLAEITRRRARQILTAGGADEVVADRGPGGHSIFTYTLLQGLGGAADANGDGFLTASEVGSYVAPRVSSLSKQTPAFGSLVGSEGGDFVLALTGPPIELLADAAAAAPPTEDPSMLARARQLLAAENDDLKRQLASMREELERFRVDRGAAPDDPTADAARLHALGLAAFHEGRLAAAVEALSRASQLDPDNVEIVNNLGYLLQRLGDHESAVPHFQRAIALDPARGVAYLNLGDSLTALDRAPEAAAAYRRYLELVPASPRRARIEAWLAAHPG